MIKIFKVLTLTCISIFVLSACENTANIKEVTSTVINIEKYGHIVLDIKASELNDKGFALGDSIKVKVNNQEVIMPYFDGYYTNPGEPLLRGKDLDKNISVCINYENFSTTYNVSVGDKVTIILHEKEKYLGIQEICSLKYSNDINDYKDVETFTNFREVTVGNIKEGKLYRGASPILSKYERTSYAHDLFKNAQIKSVLNLSDSNELIESCFVSDDFVSYYYQDLYKSGSILALDLCSNFFTDEFAVSIATALSFLSTKEAPYYIHCEEGKDRTGFTCMIIEALMGANLDEIIDDYMLSFYNYYGITKEEDQKRYQYVLEINLLEMLYYVTNTNDYESLQQVNLEDAVTTYLVNAGMSVSDINTLKEKLS